MARFPKPKEAIHAAERRGFVFARQKGSHAMYRHPDGRRVTIPIHGSKELGPELFKHILDDLGISKKTFWDLM